MKPGICAYLAGIASLIAFVAVPVAEAGCGCEKPPPVPTDVRPHAAFTGNEVTIFHDGFVEGVPYTVTFTSGITGQSRAVEATAAVRRDLADSVYKAQVAVPLPQLPLGPTSVSVAAVDGSPVISAGDSTLTVVPSPVIVPGWVKETELDHYQTAVSRDGVVYLSLDLTFVDLPLTFEFTAEKYPLRFSADDVVFYNTQGFVMQLLDQSIPGLFVLEDADDDKDSNILRYARHEFSSYFLQHDERQEHALDPEDANWHIDGTPHIDHNHLIVGITGTLQGTGDEVEADDPYNTLPEFDAPPVPGVTPEFKLVMQTHAMFSEGIVGLDAVDIAGDALARTGIVSNGSVALGGFSSTEGEIHAGVIDVAEEAFVKGDFAADEIVGIGGGALVDADIECNADVVMYGEGDVYGKVKGQYVEMWDKAEVHGEVSAVAVAIHDEADAGKIKTGKFTPAKVKRKDMLSVYPPSKPNDLGSLRVAEGTSQTLVGPGTFKATNVLVDGELRVDTSGGPVTLYVAGGLNVSAGGTLLTVGTILEFKDDGEPKFKETRPDSFAIYSLDDNTLTIGGSGVLSGVIYAPDSRVEIVDSSAFSGAVVANAVFVGNQAIVEFDDKLGENKLQQERLEESEDLMKDVDDAAKEAAKAWVDVQEATRDAMETEAEETAKAEQTEAKETAKAEETEAEETHKAEEDAADDPEDAAKIWAKAANEIAKAWEKAETKTAKAWAKAQAKIADAWAEVDELTADAHQADDKSRAAQEALMALLQAPYSDQ